MNTISYVSGKYALVDHNYGFIWLNVPSYDAALQIKKTMASHVTLVIVDLSSFSNFTDELIDSYVCLEWRVTAPGDLLRLYLQAELTHGDMNNSIQINSSNSSLKNEPSNSMLTKSRMHELQKCMILFFQIYTYAIDVKTNAYTHDKSDELFKLDLENICKIFSTEIFYNEIVSKLYDYANNMTYNVNLMACILRNINKLYE